MNFLNRFTRMFKSGTRVDLEERFELLRSAISGTMSSFYMARDRTTDKVVGLKVLDMHKRELTEGRFKNLKKPSEGEIAKSFNHPNIVRTLEYGTATNGVYYIVMEFLDGPGLNSLIIGRESALDGRRMPLIRQAAEALATVHNAGYIHRDICPRNFVVAKDLSSLKMIDFGLTVPDTADFTQPGNRTGTPNYMAPEIVRRRKTSTAVDLFAFGVTMFELCTFELPWQRGTTGKAAMSHDSEPADIRRLRPTIHPQLAEAILKCLASKPESRPVKVEHFLQMIAGVEKEDV